jgi:hypothetical protein
MPDVISEYQKWKQQGENIRSQAKQAMESRFRELLAEAASIAEEYRLDFGAPLKPAPPVTAFRYKSPGKSKAKKTPKPPAGKSSSPSRPESVPAKAAATPRPEPAPAKPDPKIVRLQQRIATAKKKLEDAKSAGSPTRGLEDRLYELEDELRLSGAPA